MSHRSSSDVFGNPIDPHAASAWTQPAALLSPFLTPVQLQWANLLVTVLFIGVVLTLLTRASGNTSISDRLFGCCFRSYIVTRTQLVCWWIYFLRAYGEVLRIETECKIAIIGDGIALGFGDFITFYSKQAGVTRRFQTALNVAGTSGALGMDWRVFNRGHFASTSENWKPTTDQRPTFHSLIMRPGSKNLFEHTFRRGGIVSDAQIVVVIVGTMDCRGEAGSEGRDVEYTVERVTELVEELHKRGKWVMLCQLHDARRDDDADVGFIGRHHHKNTQFEKIWKRLPRCYEGANFTHVKYHIHRHSDGVHFGSTGYKLASEDMLPTLLEMCQNVEAGILWDKRQKVLAEQALDKEEDKKDR